MDLLLRAIRPMTGLLMLTILGMQSLTPAMGHEREGDFTRWTPVSEEVLDGMRGGFQSGPNGPFMSFGIERSVFLNGKPVSSTVLNIPDVSKLVAGSTHALTMIQHGKGNVLPTDLSALPAFMTAIQNSKDNQHIQTQTVINATVTALTLNRSLELGHALSQANLGAIQH